jgi:WD40 repeat protein
LKEERTYSEHEDDVLTVAVHPDGRRFVSAGNEPVIRWWSLQEDKPQSRRGGHSGPVQQLAFSGNGRRLISAGGDRTVRLWNGQTGEPLRQLAGASEWQYAVALSSHGRLAAAGGWDGLARLWDTESGRLRVTLVQPPGAAGSASPGAEPSEAPWLAITPGGYVAGSAELLQIGRYRAGALALPAQAAAKASVRPEIVARAIRGEPAGSVSFPSSK